MVQHTKKHDKNNQYGKRLQLFDVASLTPEKGRRAALWVVSVSEWLGCEVARFEVARLQGCEVRGCEVARLRGSRLQGCEVARFKIFHIPSDDIFLDSSVCSNCEVARLNYFNYL